MLIKIIPDEINTLCFASKELPEVVSYLHNFDGFVKSLNPVTPAKAGVQNCLNLLDSGFRRNDNSRQDFRRAQVEPPLGIKPKRD